MKTRVAGIYDIKKRLKVGTNVIAVSSSRTSYPGSAQILVRGFIKEPSGKVTSLISDEHWRVSSHKGIVEGSEEWTSPLVEEQLWPNARRSAINGKRFRSHGSTPIRFCCNCPPPVHGLWPRTPEPRPSSRLRLTRTMPGRRHGFRWQVREMLISLSTDTSSPRAIPSSAQGKQLPHLAVPHRLRQVKALGNATSRQHQCD